MTRRMLDDLKVVREAFPRTIRLVSSARLRPPVLAALVPAEDLEALAEIEGATSQRLMAQQRGADGIDRDEFVYGVPHAVFINASFAYSKPSEPNRFNASRGAWYAALDVETCMAEVAYHMADFLGKSGRLEGVVEYAELFASMAGEFVDLREMDSHPCLNPDPATGYPIGNALADTARAQGTQRNHLSVGAAPRRDLHRGALAARGAIGRSRGDLSIRMVGRAEAGDYANIRLALLNAAAGTRRRGGSRRACD